MKDYQFYKDVFDKQIAAIVAEGEFDEENAIKIAVVDVYEMCGVSNESLNLVIKLKRSVSNM